MNGQETLKEMSNILSNQGNPNQNYHNISFYLSQNVVHTNEDVKQWEHSVSLVGVQTCTLWKSIQWFLRKLGIFLPQDPAISFLDIYSKNIPQWV